MEWWQVLLVLVAGFWAGTINSVVGSGTLVTFPVLVSVGFPPVTAQMSNAMGLVAAGFSGTWGYRRELRQSAAIIKTLTWASLMGGIIGATLLMSLPPTVFDYAAPILIVVAILFVVFQPRLNTWVRKRRQRGAGGNELMTTDISSGPTGPVTPVLFILIFLTGIYGGYFVAAQGVLLLGLLGVFLTSGTLVHANAIKTWLSLAVNLIAAASYLLFAFDRIDWTAVLLIAVSSLIGGSYGAKIGRRIKPTVLRTVIVIVGLAGMVNMIWRLVNG
ncbi:MAG TPA: sulfite exporter TauE/SafE family protein [Candidatus Yaniella excrementigallinarum]|nr:sulfite exporter TauE/SafE family protein [Candidatus Yaniella excrementigallinarum]